jgi:hypothetical protein
MIDKKLEKQINKLKDFKQAWMKFHEIYLSLVGTGSLSKDDEGIFLGEKNIIKRKYKELCDLLEMKGVSEYADPISDILNVSNLLSASDFQESKLKEEWDGSFMFLDNLVKAFEEKQARVSASLGIISFIQKLFNNIWVVIIVSMSLIFLMYYLFIKYVVVNL